MEFMVFRKIS